MWFNLNFLNIFRTNFKFSTEYVKHDLYKILILHEESQLENKYRFLKKYKKIGNVCGYQIEKF